MNSVGYIALLRNNPNFRCLYIARLISLLGDWFSLLAVLALLRSIGAGTATDFGIALILKSLPVLIATPWAGYFADRYSRIKVMVWSDILRAVLVALFFLVLVFPATTLVYTLIVLQALVATFFEPARTALLPDIVSDEELTAANALGATTWSAMLTIGAALGGVFTEFFGWEWALVIDIGTYVVSMVFLLFIQAPSRVGITGNVSSENWIAFSYMRRHIECWTLVLVKGGWNLVGGVTLMLTLLGEGTFSMGGKMILGVSVLYAARGLGTGIGPILSRYLTQSKPKRMESFIGYGYLCGAVFYIPMYWVDSIGYAIILIILAHIGGATVWVFSTIRLQQTLPEDIRGRIFAFEYAFWTIMFVLSTYSYSFLSDQFHFDSRLLLSVMGGTLLIPFGLWQLRLVWLKR
ncbi:MAG: MFS transporter [Myxococcota bacterium]|nr:MFS transporter [Myxococcota bacterium]